MRALGAYVGRHEQRGYGVVAIERKGKALRMLWCNKASALRHDRGDVFRVVWGYTGFGEKASFRTDAEGRIDGLCLPVEPAIEPIVFHRVGDPLTGLPSESKSS